MKQLLILIIIWSIGCESPAQQPSLKDQFNKIETMIPMRDGIKLFTAIYIPKNTTEKLPFLLMRTPYSVNPYGEQNFPRRLGPNALFATEPYIYVMQDVRGRYMSEGKFEEMTPHIANKKSAYDTDESTDCYDTVDWLLKNIENNNGKAGIYGISYPGFYASAALPGAHPALKAASPQAPVTDEFEGDDAYHRGAFFLMDNFSFMNGFDHPRDTAWKRYPAIFNENISDAYDFYLKLGPLKNANARYYNNKSKIWNEYLAHDTKDEYWQARNIRTHLKNVQPAVLVVGGWYDAEDLFGALKTYEAIEQQSPNNKATLVMGPWTHGGWARPDWSKYGTLNFQSNTSQYLQQKEFDFFNYYLKNKGSYKPAEATVFETGTNTWKEYPAWPPPQATKQTWYLAANQQLVQSKPASTKLYDEYVADPGQPVPYMNTSGSGRNNEYMVADQSFAAARKDVLTYQTSALEQNITWAGPINAELYASTTGTDADFVVKIIDVLPEGSTDNNGKDISGMQRLVRAEVLRGKFRNSFVKPEPFTPGKIAKVTLELNDVSHTFLKGHKIMVQVQSSWFPLVDINPNKFMSIPLATEADFQKTSIKLYHSSEYPSAIKVLTVK